MISISDLKKSIQKIEKEIDFSNHLSQLELIRINSLGKNGFFNKYYKLINFSDKEKKIELMSIVNHAKDKIKKKFFQRKKYLEKKTIQKKILKETIDTLLPGRYVEKGGMHPISRTIKKIEKFFRRLGFFIYSGKEIEDSYHNFNALNIHDYHPARDEHNTFWLDSHRLLRTHTSGMQIHYMKKHNPPIRMLSSGRVYRNDYDAMHTPMFHQVEGIVVDRKINFGHLKWIMFKFIKYFFDESFKIRFRPSYFPFTEPSAEIDIKKKDGNWLEMLGCGLIHPTVLNNVNIDSKIYSGFAFGIGIERFIMLEYKVKDIRMFFENDLRFLKQFK